ncbi:hypothetical protein KUCAC02_025386, partial [Chaenocephalus aceratus]
PCIGGDVGGIPPRRAPGPAERRHRLQSPVRKSRPPRVQKTKLRGPGAAIRSPVWGGLFGVKYCEAQPVPSGALE